MVLVTEEFDKAIIYMIRCMTKNFLRMYSDRSINELPITVSVLADAEDFDKYIDEIVMKM
jgi:hypothetical protein